MNEINKLWKKEYKELYDGLSGEKRSRRTITLK